MKNPLQFTGINKMLGLAFSVLLFTLVSCSDGMQIGQRINSIIEENGIETITITSSAGNGGGQSIELQAGKVVIDNQFLKSGDQYINLGTIKTLKVNGKKLEVSM